jgi:hypothetical protein
MLQLDFGGCYIGHEKVQVLMEDYSKLKNGLQHK